MGAYCRAPVRWGRWPVQNSPASAVYDQRELRMDLVGQDDEALSLHAPGRVHAGGSDRSGRRSISSAQMAC